MWPLKRHPASPAYNADMWAQASKGQGVLETLSASEQMALWALAQDFLHSRSIIPVGDLTLGDVEKLRIALLACLPILGLDLGWYRGLHEVVVYPDAFTPEHTWMDTFGITHTGREVVSGEAWDQGLMLLSWADLQASGPLDGRHVVLHECAHWLDLQNGAANGRPPLHPGMSPDDWTDHFSAAYAAFSASPVHTCKALSPYAATSPAEFFAVCCELFLERPSALHRCWPDLHRLLTTFFHQTPDIRLSTFKGKPQ